MATKLDKYNDTDKSYCIEKGLSKLFDQLAEEVITNKPENPEQFLIHRLQQRTSGALKDPSFNKGTAFTASERREKGLEGLLPVKVETLEEQRKRALFQLVNLCPDDVSKYLFLNNLRSGNDVLFYDLVGSHPDLCMPLIYTPTVGLVCEKFDQLWTHPTGVFLNRSHAGKVRSVLDNWTNDVDIIVVTDGSRILGLGDLGMNGMGIPVGKLSLYVACAGFSPERCLPITLDLGCRQEYRDKTKFYVGEQNERLSGDEYMAFLEEFVMAVKDKWPSSLLQFEDFSNDHAFLLLDKYRSRFRCFNDDIQGTGAVIAAGFINAVKLSGVDWKDQRVVFFGAGAAGVGVANMMRNMIIAHGATPEQALKAFYLVDTQGLVTTTREGTLADHKRDWARSDVDKELGTLEDVIDHVRPTCLVGLSTQGGRFTEEIIRKMATFSERPIIMPLSNPTPKAETTAENAYKWTDGRAIVASGSPFPPYTHGSKTLIPGQGNNMYIFPGLGLGAWIGQVKEVTEEMIAESSLALSECVDQERMEASCVYPPLTDIRDISRKIAVRVLQKAKEQGMLGADIPGDLDQHVRSKMWNPSYGAAKM